MTVEPKPERWMVPLVCACPEGTYYGATQVGMVDTCKRCHRITAHQLAVIQHFAATSPAVVPDDDAARGSLTINPAGNPRTARIAEGALIVTHDMWIDDEGNDLDYLPEREARIANFINEAADHLAPLLAAARAAGVAQERERIVARLRRLSDEASVRELADHNAYARRCAYDRAARIAEGAEQTNHEENPTT